MSIYIKGMEMPTGNGELRLIIHSNGQVIISHKTHYEEAEALPVPEHGRLSDADALKEHMFVCADDPYRLGWNDALEAVIQNAPTIIPADNEGNA